MADSFDIPAPDRFTAGALGPPGQRVFYLQASGEGVLVSLKCEKQHVGALADYLAGVLADLPEVDPTAADDARALIEPVTAEWAVGSLAVAWDETDDRVVLVIEEQVIAPGETDEAGDAPDLDVSAATARVRLTREQVAAFIATAAELMQGGRPPCPVCGGPMNPDGHVCPRSNGQRH